MLVAANHNDKILLPLMHERHTESKVSYNNIVIIVKVKLNCIYFKINCSAIILCYSKSPNQRTYIFAIQLTCRSHFGKIFWALPHPSCQRIFQIFGIVKVSFPKCLHYSEKIKGWLCEIQTEGNTTVHPVLDIAWDCANRCGTWNIWFVLRSFRIFYGCFP